MAKNKATKGTVQARLLIDTRFDDDVVPCDSLIEADQDTINALVNAGKADSSDQAVSYKTEQGSHIFTVKMKDKPSFDAAQAEIDAKAAKAAEDAAKAEAEAAAKAAEEAAQAEAEAAAKAAEEAAKAEAKAAEEAAQADTQG